MRTAIAFLFLSSAIFAAASAQQHTNYVLKVSEQPAIKDVMHSRVVGMPVRSCLTYVYVDCDTSTSTFVYLQ